MLVRGILALTAVTTALAGYPRPAEMTGDYEVQDPSMVKTPEGTYIVAGTGSKIPIKTSTDRLHWTAAGDAFPDGLPADALARAGNKDAWAPDLSYVDGQYLMYYCVSQFGTQKSAIYLATSSTGMPGSWTDKGLVVESVEGDPYNAYLTWGSYWDGIFIATVEASTGMLVSKDKKDYTNLAKRPGAGVIEAAFLYETKDGFYLFTSWDVCCNGTSSNYNMRVVTSASLLGPYYDSEGKKALDGAGTLLMDSHDDIYGPGGQSLLVDDDGVLLVYHHYTNEPSEPTKAMMGLNYLAL
ncbi:hypothetical protein JCM11641_000246 [Rhodosporidiobolus odoratus]